MIPKGLFTQIGMVIVAVSIIITYVQPAFAKIGSVQDIIEVYSQERKKVESVNAKLSKLMSDIENVSNDDRRQLLTYLPDSVDEIAVPRDLVLITAEAGVLYKNSSFVGLDETLTPKSSGESINLPKAYSFTLSVEGTYDQLKNLFRLMEQNNYPLEVRSVEIDKIDGGFLGAEIQLITFSYQDQIMDNKIVF